MKKPSLFIWAFLLSTSPAFSLEEFIEFTSAKVHAWINQENERNMKEELEQMLAFPKEETIQQLESGSKTAAQGRRPKNKVPIDDGHNLARNNNQLPNYKNEPPELKHHFIGDVNGWFISYF